MSDHPIPQGSNVEAIPVTAVGVGAGRTSTNPASPWVLVVTLVAEPAPDDDDQETHVEHYALDDDAARYLIDGLKDGLAGIDTLRSSN